MKHKLFKYILGEVERKLGILESMYKGTVPTPDIIQDETIIDAWLVILELYFVGRSGGWVKCQPG